MPIYTVQGPDGKTYEVEGPAGATAEQLGAVISGQSKQDRAAANLAADREKYAPTVGMSGTDKFLSGVGKAFSDLGTGTQQVAAGVADFVSPAGRVEKLREQVAENRALDAQLMKTGAGVAGNITGNVAAAVPAAFIPGANTVVGAGLVGAGMGALAPSTSGAETLGNIGMGGVGGALVPAGVQGAKTAKSLIDPLYQEGRNKIMGRALAKTAGDGAASAVQAMKTVKSAVPGVQLTAAEAAGNPGIAALQRTATAADPIAMNALSGRQASNNDALVAALRAVAPDKAVAKQARETAANSLYAASGAKPVQITPEIQALLQRPSMQNAVQRAQKLAAEKGVAFDLNSLTGEGAHYIKMAMDDIAGSGPASGIGKNEIGSVRDTLTDFLGKLETQIPEYGQARASYAAGSKPINQAEIVEKIEEGAINKLRGNITPAAYAKALTDKTAQSVTKQPNATLAGVMEPSQLDALNVIKDDLFRADFANTAGKGVGSDTVQKLAFTNMLDAAGVPSAVRGFAPAGVIGSLGQRAGQIIYKDANEKMSAQLAQALLNPMDAAALMEAGMVTPKMLQMAEALRRPGAALGAAAPGMIQANKE